MYKFNYHLIEESANADKLFIQLLKSIEEKKFDYYKKFMIGELEDIVPFIKGSIKRSTYNYSFLSMLSGQKERDYFIYSNTELKDKFTNDANDNKRSYKSWRKYNEEKVAINPKYIEKLSNTAYLMVYNPDEFLWNDIELAKEEIEQKGYYLFSWSSGTRKNFVKGARVYLIQLGVENKGIFASGWIDDSAYKGSHWSEDELKKNTEANYVPIVFDNIINPQKEDILAKDILDNKFEGMIWSQRASGTEIKCIDLNRLESEWISHLTGSIDFNKNATDDNDNGKYIEGSSNTIDTIVYERNQKARKECLNKYGYKCRVCGLKMEEVYGEVAKKIIDVHHIKPLAEIKNEYEVDPIKDLIPVCPNCHAVIHRANISVSELKRMLNKS